MYDQFRHVVQGDIYRTKNFGVHRYPRDLPVETLRSWGMFRADRTICAAKVQGTERDAGFTVVSYTGPEAKEAFEKDFRRFSGMLTAGSFQVYGINTYVPTMLFYHVLQPVANFLNDLGFWGRLYLDVMRRQFTLFYPSNEMWLDSQRGVICRGPAGPHCWIPYSTSSGGLPIPESAEHLHGNNYLRYLAHQKSKDVDRVIAAVFSYPYHDKVSEVGVNQLTIFSTRTNAAITVEDGVWKKGCTDCLGEGEVMESGETRFTLKGVGRLWIKTDLYKERIAWMPQASSVFHALGVSLDDNLEDYELNVPDLWLQGHLSESNHLRQTLKERPIHLFTRCLSASTPSRHCMTSALHYWSFDPTGRHPLSAETCNHLGLPTKLSLIVYSPQQYRWSNESYRRMHEYQLARGFDPTTTDFARHLGNHIYSIMYDADRFEELLTPSLPSLLDEPQQ